MNSCEKIIEDVLTENYGQFTVWHMDMSEMRRTPWILSRKAPIKP